MHKCGGAFLLFAWYALRMEFRSDITVDLVKYSAADMDVVSAARVSTKGRSLEAPSIDEQYGLINFLMRERHGSPFEHAYFTFYVEAPIFVWREHMRHRIASYNEESGRYKKLEPVFYIPDDERPLLQVGKAGHYDFKPGSPEQTLEVKKSLEATAEFAYANYEHLLDTGVAREVARMSLPLNIYSSAYVTMNVRALMNFLSLRVKSELSSFPSYPQKEIQMVADRYEAVFAMLMPLTHAAFEACGRVSP